MTVFKGSQGSGIITVGTEPAPAGSGDCGGQIGLDVGDHVLLAFEHPETALAVQTAAWWIEPDATVRRNNLIANWNPTTYAAVLRDLRLGMPDTATADDTPRKVVKTLSSSSSS
ncbi:MAG: hypothetical protein L0221_01060 [Chloroflexi bacterium]|nr:hypothetical protein [Chloroflexota bacterium]